MLIHHLTMALRAARRTPFASAINVLTLAAGLYCFLVAYAFANYWASAERHFASADRIQVLVSTLALTDGSIAIVGDIASPLDAAEYLRVDFPDLERVARASLLYSERIVASGAHGQRLTVLAADPDFLHLFDLPFLSGDARRALDSPRSAVLSADAAERLLGSRDALGRPLRLDNDLDLTVTGVIDAIPEPSHLARTAQAPLGFDLLVSHDIFDTLHPRAAWPGAPEGHRWMNQDSTTYLLLPSDGSLTPAALKARLAGFAERHIPAEVRTLMQFDFDLIPVTALLAKSVNESLFPQAAVVSVSSLLLLLGGLVLAVACINYASLATARAVRRVREAGLRKVLGARPAAVLVQHLVEAALATSAALVISLVALRMSGPLLENMAGLDPGPVLFEGATLPYVIIAIALIVATVAGAYPAFAVSRVPPMDAIRGSRLRIGPRRLAMLMVGAQFTGAAFLLIAVAVVWTQNAELERTALGRIADPLLIIENQSAQTGVTTDTLRAELARIPQVNGITDLASVPWLDFGGRRISLDSDPSSQGTLVMTQQVGPDFFTVFEIPPIAGRLPAADVPEDLPPASESGQPPAGPQSAVVDRAFLGQFGFDSPADALGAVLYSSLGGASMIQEFRIVGVVDTVPWSLVPRLGVRGTATMYTLSPGNWHVVARVAADDVSGALAAIDAAWERLAPSVPINRRFLDDAFAQAFVTFARINLVFIALALIAFLIATAGLVAIATLVAGRRMREVAIRKTHGAHTGQMVAMLLASFTKPVLIANLIAWPVAFIAVRRYLDVFLNPIALTPLPFLLCLAFTLAIAWIAVGGQTLRAARTMPAEVLRSE